MKKLFPIFKNNPSFVYLDSAASTQKPSVVIDAVTNHYSNFNSNIHRGLYPIAEKATEMFEEARETVAKFINAEKEEIIFTYGTTDSLNAVACMLKESGVITNNSKILIPDSEHHSNILPWQHINPNLNYLTLDNNFLLKESSDTFDLFSYALASNVTGSIYSPKINAGITVIDAAQAVAHLPIDVKKLNCDFLAFSGHKIFAPTGIGVLYINKKWLDRLTPYRLGGGMIVDVYRNKASWVSYPHKFEAGTPAIEGAIGLKRAIEFVTEIKFSKIEESELILRNYLLNKLKEIDEIEIFHPDVNTKSLGIISFSCKKIHPHDIAEFLGKHNICVRAGHHCTQILHREVFNVPATVRASVSIYNDNIDIDMFIFRLKESLLFFKS